MDKTQRARLGGLSAKESIESNVDLIKRNKEIIDIRKSKKWSLEKISVFFGITNQRVYQIVGKTGFYTSDVSKINKAVDYLNLDTSKTNDEMIEITGKIPIWNGLRHAVKDGSQARMGFDIEDYVSKLLTEMGINHTVTNSRKYDIVLQNGKTVEVRSRYKSENVKTKNFYFFSLQSKMNIDNPADFFILVIVKEGKKDCFVIPKEIVPPGEAIGFTWPKSDAYQSRSIWTDYHNKFDLLGE